MTDTLQIGFRKYIRYRRGEEWRVVEHLTLLHVIGVVSTCEVLKLFKVLKRRVAVINNLKKLGHYK